MNFFDHNNNETAIYLLRSGNEDSFAALYRAYFKPLCTYASQYVEEETCKEIVQDTMLWLWENKNALILEMSLKSLLFTIVKNKCLNITQREKVKSNVLRSIQQKYEDRFNDPDFYFEQELFSTFQKSLEELPENYRIVFEMSRVDGFTHKEIAEKLGVSVQTVNYRLSKALELLRKRLRDWLPILLFLLET